MSAPENRMVTINDVAKLAGVSIATVSNVINNNPKASAQTIERVRAAIRQLNYIPNNIAKGLKTSTTRTISVLVEDITSFIAPGIIDGIGEFCEEQNYQINLANLGAQRKAGLGPGDVYVELEHSPAFRQSVQGAVNALLAARGSGLIYVGVHPRDVGGFMPPVDIPVVFAYCYSREHRPGRVQNVHFDDLQGARLATEHLIANGHEKIGVIGGVASSYSSIQRIMGYQTALMEHGLPYVPEYLVMGDWSTESGYRQLGSLMALPDPPTAVFALNDRMAYGALAAARDRGLRVPEDLSVHGFDDMMPSPFITPALSTIALPLHAVGMQAARSVVALIERGADDPEPERFVTIPCSHVARDSVRSLGKP